MSYPVNCSSCCEAGNNCCANIGYYKIPIENRQLDCNSTNLTYYPNGIIKTVPNTAKPGCAKCPYMEDTGFCSIYENRPLECRVYPFFIDNNNNLYLSYSCSDYQSVLTKLYSGDSEIINQIQEVKKTLSSIVPEEVKSTYKDMLSNYKFYIKLNI